MAQLLRILEVSKAYSLEVVGERMRRANGLPGKEEFAIVRLEFALFFRFGIAKGSGLLYSSVAPPCSHRSEAYVEHCQIRTFGIKFPFPQEYLAPRRHTFADCSN